MCCGCSWLSACCQFMSGVYTQAPPQAPAGAAEDKIDVTQERWVGETPPTRLLTPDSIFLADVADVSPDTVESAISKEGATPSPESVGLADRGLDLGLFDSSTLLSNPLDHSQPADVSSTSLPPIVVSSTRETTNKAEFLAPPVPLTSARGCSGSHLSAPSPLSRTPSPDPFSPERAASEEKNTLGFLLSRTPSPLLYPPVSDAACSSTSLEDSSHSSTH